MGSLSNIKLSGMPSMGFHANPSLMRLDGYSADWGVGFYGYCAEVTCCLPFCVKCVTCCTAVLCGVCDMLHCHAVCSVWHAALRTAMLCAVCVWRGGAGNCACQPACPPAHLPACPPPHLPICLPTCPPTRPPACPPACLPPDALMLPCRHPPPWSATHCSAGCASGAIWLIPCPR